MKHFPINQYVHDRVTPFTLSPKPIVYDKPIDPSEMPRISTCTDTITNDTNVLTKDDKYPWLDPEDKQRHMTDAKILRQKLNLEDSLLDKKGKEEFLTKTDGIPLNFLQHFTPNYIEHAYSHWVENLYVHKTKDCDTTQVKRKCSRPPRQKIEQNEIQIQL